MVRTWMVRMWSPMTAWAFVVLLGGWGAPLCAQGLEIRDDFEDGDFADGVPATWEVKYPLSGTQHPNSSVEIVAGDLVCTGYAGLVTKVTEDGFAGDVSVRTQCAFRGIEPGTEAYLGVIAHGTLVPLNGYIGGVTNRGKVWLGRLLNSGYPWESEMLIPGFSADEDWVIQLDVKNAEAGSPSIEVRVWRAGDCPPAGPNLQRVDNVYRSGQVALIFWDGLSDRAAGQGLFRFAWAREGAPFSECELLLKRGDANASNAIDIADAVCILAYLFGRSEDPCKQSVSACLDAADVNDDGTIDIADPVRLLAHLFAQAGPLPPPFDSCGIDPTTDALGCQAYSPCE